MSEKVFAYTCSWYIWNKLLYFTKKKIIRHLYSYYANDAGSIIIVAKL